MHNVAGVRRIVLWYVVLCYLLLEIGLYSVMYGTLLQFCTNVSIWLLNWFYDVCALLNRAQYDLLYFSDSLVL